jgi:hypothetical protein
MAPQWKVAKARQVHLLNSEKSEDIRTNFEVGAVPYDFLYAEDSNLGLKSKQRKIKKSRIKGP